MNLGKLLGQGGWQIWDNACKVPSRSWDWRSSIYGVFCFWWLFVVVQLLSHIGLFVTAWTTAHQAPLPSPFASLLKLMSIESGVDSTISSSVTPLSSVPQSFPASWSFLMSWLFISGGQDIGASASASVLPMNIQGWFPLGWLVGSPRSPRDSQESSPAPQFEGISSLAVSLLYGPTLISIHDYWKNYSFD